MGLFDPQVSRKPNNYPWTQDIIDALWTSHWTPNEFNFRSDYGQFYGDLTAQEQGVIVRTLSAIGQIEIAVKRFWGDIGKVFPHPGISDMGFVMANNEVVHNLAYEKLLDILNLQSAFDEALKEPSISGRVEYLRKYLDRIYVDDRKQYVYALILFTLFIENTSLFGQFYTILHFNRFKNVLKDTAQQVMYTRSEEDCFVKGTEVLTPTGWKDIFDMKIGDDVIQYNKEGTLSRTKVLNTIRKPYAGKIMSFEWDDYKCMVTPTHNMVTYQDVNNLKLVQAQDVDLSSEYTFPFVDQWCFGVDKKPLIGWTTTDQILRTSHYYEGEVGCITVPSGMIVTRYEDKTFIAGNCHTKAGILLINTLRQEYPELFDDHLYARVREEVENAIIYEGKVIDWMLGDYTDKNLSTDIVKAYIKNRMNIAMELAGFEGLPLTDEEQALLPQTKWMDEELKGETLTDFFQQRPVNYTKKHRAFDAEELF